MRVGRDLIIAIVLGVLFLTGSPWWWGRFLSRTPDATRLNGRYVVAGSDNTALEAQGTVRKIAVLGGPKPVILLRGTWYKVLVGPFDSAGEAELAVRSIDSLIHSSPETLLAVEQYCPNFSAARVDTVALLKCGA
jgi:SPOR domain